MQLVLALLVAAAGPLAARARAAGDASAAAGFVESAQNRDGGFGAQRRQRSDARTSLWTTVALLAAGRNPKDERVNNGASADDYLAGHVSAYRSPDELGLLALIQAASGAAASRYGDPGTRLQGELTPAAIKGDPGGAALGVLGLLALDTGGARQAAAAAARSLLDAQLPDGGWGASDSASTALVLEALAESRVAGLQTPAVQNAIAYLHKAQVNDGSIAASDRTDPSSSGDVGATAFTIQALAALRAPAMRTPTGTTVRQGLASYQQQGTGGLSPFGAYDTQVAPSVADTAKAYSAFDGVSFPLPPVPPAPPAPKPAAHPRPAPAAKAPDRASAGSASTGISAGTPNPSRRRVAAFKGASAAGSVKAKSGRSAPAAGRSVTGQVVGAAPAPRLAIRAGRPPAKDRSALILAGLLAACAMAGAALDGRRPSGRRSMVARGVGAGARLLASARTRGAMVPLAAALIGAALVVLPFATGLWGAAPKGARMIRSFAPYMQPQHVQRLQLEVAQLDGAVGEAWARGPALQFPGARSATTARQRFVAADPELAQFAQGWPATHAHFEHVLDPIQSSTGDYAAVAALPSLEMFPWFLLVPGAALLLLAATALARPRAWPRLRWAVVALGVALIVAPLALQMVGRAGKGQQMIRAFRTVETRAMVTTIQNDFGSLAIGQGSLRTELLPALTARGWSSRRVARALPAVRSLDDRWVQILGDFTPVIGVMSDNVANYQAVARMPPFTVFPWMFLVPGAAVLALIGVTGGGRALLRSGRLPAFARSQRNLTTKQGAL